MNWAFILLFGLLCFTTGFVLDSQLHKEISPNGTFVLEQNLLNGEKEIRFFGLVESKNPDLVITDINKGLN
jgi:hypothetical protein